ncbi:DUF1176 domain-containing protein [Nostocales cyanobacterium LEGE 11386]|nr:DUF1176 domain-containing protein [Nostocales cyanobacterium LEGE 11386]
MHTAKAIAKRCCFQPFAPFTTIIVSSLISCASIPAPELTQSAQQPQPPSIVADKPNSERILNEVISRQKSLQVCDFEFNPETARQSSEVYSNKEGQHLVQLLCFMAAYQGRFAFLEVDTSQPELKIQPLELELAGFPQFDPQTNILSNSYKFIGAGTCLQTTQYYWRDDALRLISSEIVDGQPNGCQELGVRSPSANQLITNKNVGPAKLGMTLGQLKQVLGEEAKFAPASLGVDAGEGIKVSQEGTLQYALGFTAEGKQPITDNSVINSITVSNPDYRTTAGVGPGTPLKQAVAIYGPATLFYNWNNEGREYIEFEQGLGSGVLIRSNQWTITDFAGIYADTKAEFNKTQKFHEHAGIGSITIRQ